MKRAALSLLVCLSVGGLATAQDAPRRPGRIGLVRDGLRPRIARPEAPLSPELALQKAAVEGKYRMLLRQISVPDDRTTYGDFHDYGPWAGTEWKGHTGLPPGHWVYVRPYWYIWRDLAADARPMRNWGPEQATGGPDTPTAGDIPTAWASRSPDSQEEWLMLEYEAPMVPKAVAIHATYNPGAVVKVTAFRLDGEEVTLWTGKDPAAPENARGESVIPVQADFKTNRIKVYLDSPAVPGWNEIDAVGLVDPAGKTQWATAAHASTTYAEPEAMSAFPSAPIPADPEILQQRIDRLEAELARQGELIRKLQEQLKQRR